MARKNVKEKEIESQEIDLKEQEEKYFEKLDEEDKMKEVEVKEVKEYKKVWERMKQDKEINFCLQESYEKAQLIILYQILEELRKK